jgi:hypothetical protein
VIDTAHRRVHRLTSILLLAGAALSPSVTDAQQSSAPAVDRSRWQSGWYVVRPGDTLEGLAADLLGSSELWRELAALNPGVSDPDLIFPGQRIRVLQAPPTAEPTALVVSVSRRVEVRPQPTPWRLASEGDLLIDRDSLRTFSLASSLLRFDDGSEVTLTEDSLVFLRNLTPTRSPRPRREIEVLVGQADVLATHAAGRPIEVEVVVGGARSVGTADETRSLRTRSRLAASEAAQFMTYEGATRVAAAGREIEVPAGSGTQVAPRQTPGPVEALLAAPAPVAPGDGAELERDAARLSWNAVSGAASYQVEVCADPGCGALLERAQGLAATHYALADTTPDRVYWRVTAISASGLDGFPSAARSARLVESIAPAAPVLSLLAPGGAELAAGGCVASPPAVAVRAQDRRGGELAWTLLVDGQPSDAAGLAALAGGLGRHRVAARASDARGRTATSEAVEFELDGASPWLALAASGGGPDREERRRLARRPYPQPARHPSGCGEVALEAALLPDGAQQAVPCGGEARPLRLAVEGDSARVELAVAGSPLRVGEQVDAGASDRLRLTASDVGCGLAALELRIVPSRFAAGTQALEVVAFDRAGNRLTGEWHLEPRARSSRE